MNAVTCIVEANRQHLGGLARHQEPRLRERILAARQSVVVKNVAFEPLDPVVLPDAVSDRSGMLEADVFVYFSCRFHPALSCRAGTVYLV